MYDLDKLNSAVAVSLNHMREQINNLREDPDTFDATADAGTVVALHCLTAEVITAYQHIAGALHRLADAGERIADNYDGFRAEFRQGVDDLHRQMADPR
jgi:hypothetical protein